MLGLCWVSLEMGDNQKMRKLVNEKIRELENEEIRK